MAVTQANKAHADKPQFLGLSTDTKPTTGIGANALFYELDTKKLFYFDGTQWKEIGT